MTLYFEDGTAPVVLDNFALAANSRSNLLAGGSTSANSSLIGKKFGTVVESLGANPVELVVERAMYWNCGGAELRGRHERGGHPRRDQALTVY